MLPYHVRFKLPERVILRWLHSYLSVCVEECYNHSSHHWEENCRAAIFSLLSTLSHTVVDTLSQPGKTIGLTHGCVRTLYARSCICCSVSSQIQGHTHSGCTLTGKYTHAQKLGIQPCRTQNFWLSLSFSFVVQRDKNMLFFETHFMKDVLDIMV